MTPTHVLTGGLSQQTLHTHPMSVECWASVANAGLTALGECLVGVVFIVL